MRNMGFAVLAIAMLLMGCGGGSTTAGPPAVNPTGTWFAPGDIMWDITANQDGTYTIDSGPDSDLMDYTMTIVGSTYTAYGLQVSDGWRYERTITGSIGETEMTCNLLYTVTSPSGDIEVSSDHGTAHR
jgi:hypothetical protein